MDFVNGDDSKTGVIFIFLVSIRKKIPPHCHSGLENLLCTRFLRIFSLTATYTMALRQSKFICSALSFYVYLQPCLKSEPAKSDAGMNFLLKNILYLCCMALPAAQSCMSYDDELKADADGMTTLSVRGYVYEGSDSDPQASALGGQLYQWLSLTGMMSVTGHHSSRPGPSLRMTGIMKQGCSCALTGTLS